MMVHRTRSRAAAKVLWLLMGCVFLGCEARSRLPGSDYAEPNGWKGRNSVAGASILKNALNDAGLSVYKVTGLSKRAHRFQTLFWFPTDLGVPSPEACDWFEDWLDEDPNRMLVYLGRDCNPMELYWRTAADQSPPELAMTFRTEAAHEKSQLDAMRQALDALQCCRWFVLDHQRAPLQTTAWSTNFEDYELSPPATPFWLASRIVPSSEYSEDELRNKRKDGNEHWKSEWERHRSYKFTWMLKADDETPFLFEASRRDRLSGSIWIAANALPLLNLGIVDPQNREFVEALIDVLPEGDVGILVAPHAVSIVAHEGSELEGFGLFRTWPLNLVSFHAAILGLILAIALFPILGRAKRLPEPSTQDFGEHVRALGDAMRATQDRSFALKSVAQYFRTVRGDGHHRWARVDIELSDSHDSTTKTIKP